MLRSFTSFEKQKHNETTQTWTFFETGLDQIDYLPGSFLVYVAISIPQMWYQFWAQMFGWMAMLSKFFELVYTHQIVFI